MVALYYFVLFGLVFGLDESIQVCPSSLYVAIPTTEETATVSVTITNLKTEPAFISIWVNDTFNNPRDAEWRAGSAKLPPHNMYIRDETNGGTAAPTTTSTSTLSVAARLGGGPDARLSGVTQSGVTQSQLLDDPRPRSRGTLKTLTVDDSQAEQPIPPEWRNLHLRLPGNVTSLIAKSKVCSVTAPADKPSWARRVECPSLAAKLAGQYNCRIRATVGADDRSVNLKASPGCKKRELLARVAEYKSVLNAESIFEDEFLRLQGVLSASPRETPSFTPDWPTEWPFDPTYNYSGPYNWTNAFVEWPTLSQYTIAKSPGVMVIDTYARLDHPDLLMNYVLNSDEILGSTQYDDDGDYVVDNRYGLDGNNMELGDPSWADSMDHGTAVAGIIAARPSNDVSAAGVAPNLRVLPCGAGTESLSMVATVTCMQYAYYNAKRFNIRIINHSYSGSTYRDDEISMFRELEQIGMIHTVASGNIEQNITEQENLESPLMYLAYDGMYSLIGVGRLNENQEPDDSGYSTYWTAFYFPGSLIVLYIDETNVGFGSGTSYAAPAAAGMIGQMLTVNPMLELFDVLWIIENSIVPLESVKEKCRFGGYPDVGRAIRAAQGLWARVAREADQQITLLPGETRTVDITVRLDQLGDDADGATERNGYVVVYGRNDTRLSGVYKMGEIPIKVVRDTTTTTSQ